MSTLKGPSLKGWIPRPDGNIIHRSLFYSPFALRFPSGVASAQRSYLGSTAGLSGMSVKNGMRNTKGVSSSAVAR